MNAPENWDNLTTAAKSVRLTDAERAAGRDMLASFMALTPRRAVASKRTMFFGRFTTSVATATAAALSLSGVAFAAESALPGDLLYPVKVTVNEEVRTALTVDAESQARWETERAARRLDEAEALARKGALPEAKRVKLEAQVKVHTDRVKVAAEKLRKEESPDVAAAAVADLEGTLRAHGRIIKAIAVERREAVSALAESVREEEGSAADERGRDDEVERTSEKVSDRATVQRRAAAAKKIAAVRAYLEKVDGADAARAKLTSADERMAAADAFVETGDAKSAIRAYIDAQRIAQEASVIARASVNLRLRIGAGTDEREGMDGEKETKKDEDGDKEVQEKQENEEGRKAREDRDSRDDRTGEEEVEEGALNVGRRLRNFLRR